MRHAVGVAFLLACHTFPEGKTPVRDETRQLHDEALAEAPRALAACQARTTGCEWHYDLLLDALFQVRASLDREPDYHTPATCRCLLKNVFVYLRALGTSSPVTAKLEPYARSCNDASAEP